MRVRVPIDHLIPDEKTERLFQLPIIRPSQTSRDGHDGDGEDALGVDGTHEFLQVGRETEGDGLGVVKEGFGARHAGHEFAGPDVGRRAGNVQFVRVAVVHVQDVGHEGVGGELVGEVLAEEPEVGEGGVDG